MTPTLSLTFTVCRSASLLQICRHVVAESASASTGARNHVHTIISAPVGGVSFVDMNLSGCQCDAAVVVTLAVM